MLSPYFGGGTRLLDRCHREEVISLNSNFVGRKGGEHIIQSMMQWSEYTRALHTLTPVCLLSNITPYVPVIT
jgi:hypothetical protein